MTTPTPPDLPGSLADYLALVTSRHRVQPNYTALLSLFLDPLVSLQALLSGMPALFNIDAAVGQQLDMVGQWIGVTRDLNVPLIGVYFELDNASLGLDQGSLQGPDDPVSGLVQLPDDAYRTLLRARIAANNWNGTIPGAYSVWDIAFAGTGTGILIQDLDNMHMIYALTGAAPDALTLALFQSGELSLKPAGVRIDLYITPPPGGTPYFGLGVENASISGLDVGAFGVETAGA